MWFPNLIMSVDIAYVSSVGVLNALLLIHMLETLAISIMEVHLYIKRMTEVDLLSSQL